MTYVDRIIETFGGVRALARRMGRPASTVASWAERGSIPDAEKAALLAMAQRDDVALTAVDFFPFDRMPTDDEAVADATQQPPLPETLNEDVA